MDNNENQVNVPGAGENPPEATENNGIPAEVVEEVVVEAEVVDAEPEEVVKAPKKASPFADSPYVIQGAPEKPKAAPKAKKKKPGKGFQKVLCAVLAAVLLVGACTATALVVADRYEDRMDQMETRFEDRLEELKKELEKTDAAQPGASQVVTPSGLLTPAQVYAMNCSSVVLIQNTYTNSYGQTGISTGSGFIISEDGYVVTNHHVIEGNGKLVVVGNNGSGFSATLVGSDSANDVALLKMEGSGFPAVKLGDSDKLIVGDQVAAIGNPLGELTSTLTVGYISAMGRDVNTSGFAINMIQTDAAINSGNSGGPLFNMNGEVIGITTAKYSGSSSSGASIEGIGFAIPINDVRDLLDDLTTNGKATTPYLGVSVTDVDPEAAAYFGMPLGARVEEVVAGAAADRAGLKPKDIIVKLGQYEVGNVNELTRALRKYKVGETVTMVVYRSGAKVEMLITLDQRPEDLTAQTPQNPMEGLPQEGMPEEGDLEEWFNYLFPYYGGND